MKYRTILIALFILLNGCVSKEEVIIKKDLDTRWTGFDIVEIRADSANIYTAVNILRSLELNILNSNNKIISALLDFERGNSIRNGSQTLLYVDSIYKKIEDRMTAFERSRYDRPDKCYYVKYLVFSGARKIEKEEYYHLRLMNDGNYDIIHRPYDWNEFMFDKEYDKLIDEALKYQSDILDLRWKYGK